MPRLTGIIAFVLIGGLIVGGILLLQLIDEPVDRQAAAAAAYAPIEAQLAEIDAAEQKGDVDPRRTEMVIEQLRQLVEEYPEFEPARNTLARLEAYALQERVTQAMDKQLSLAVFLPEAQALVDTAPRLVEARVLLGQILLQTDQKPRALQQFAEAVNLRPGDAELRSLTGTLLLDGGAVEEAIESYRAAVELAPNQADRHRVFLGNALFKDGKLDEAETEYDAVIDLNGSAHRAYAGLADIYAARGEIDQAMAMMADAILWVEQDEDADPLDYVRMRWKLLNDAGRAGEAMAEVRRLPREIRVTPEVSEDVAMLARSMNAPMMAAGQYALLVGRDPTNTDALAEAVHWHIMADDRETAATYYARLMMIAPNHPKAAELGQSLRDAPSTTPATQ